MGIYADIAIPESPCPETPATSNRTNRAFALNQAITATDSLHGRAVFQVSAIFLEFLDAAHNALLRRRALAQAVARRNQRTAGDHPIDVAIAIVESAKAFLFIMSPTEAPS
jgi:hypothetical protein